jgi:hypothetical protein
MSAANAAIARVTADGDFDVVTYDNTTPIEDTPRGFTRLGTSLR